MCDQTMNSDSYLLHILLYIDKMYQCIENILYHHSMQNILIIIKCILKGFNAPSENHHLKVLDGFQCPSDLGSCAVANKSLW